MTLLQRQLEIENKAASFSFNKFMNDISKRIQGSSAHELPEGTVLLRTCIKQVSEKLDEYFKAPIRGNAKKARGYIEVQGQGITRIITVLKELPVSKHSYKKEIIETMIGKYMEDFEDCGTLNDRIEVGKVILRLLEKL